MRLGPASPARGRHPDTAHYFIRRSRRDRVVPLVLIGNASCAFALHRARSNRATVHRGGGVVGVFSSQEPSWVRHRPREDVQTISYWREDYDALRHEVAVFIHERRADFRVNVVPQSSQLSYSLHRALREKTRVYRPAWMNLRATGCPPAVFDFFSYHVSIPLSLSSVLPSSSVHFARLTQGDRDSSVSISSPLVAAAGVRRRSSSTIGSY